MQRDNLSLSVIIPAYNEEKNIEDTINDIFDVLPGIANDFEVIVINDGSKDRTPEILSNLKNKYRGLEIICHEKNRGYGNALISGFNKANKEYIFFMDADKQFNFKEIERLLIFKDNYDIITGVRIERNDGLLRELTGTIFNFIVKFIFKIPIMDINCGFKLFKTEVIKELNLYSAGALINTEILAKTKRNNRSLMLVGVSHYPRKEGRQTGASLKVIFRALLEIAALKYNLLKNS